MNKGSLGSILSQKDSVRFIGKSTFVIIVAASVLLSGFFVATPFAHAALAHVATLNVVPTNTITELSGGDSYYADSQSLISRELNGLTLNELLGSDLTYTVNVIANPLFAPNINIYLANGDIIQAWGKDWSSSGLQTVSLTDLVTGVRGYGATVNPSLGVAGAINGGSAEDAQNDYFHIANLLTDFGSLSVAKVEVRAQAGASGGQVIRLIKFIAAGITDYTSIQSAIDDASSDDTINVAAGTYPEQVTINKALTLNGVGDTTIIQSPDILTSTFSDSASHAIKPVVTVIGANATLSQFKIDGLSKGNANNRFVGIGLYNASGNLNNITVMGIRDNPLSGVQHGVGIYAYNADSSPRSLTVSNNTVIDYQKNGMNFTGAGLSVDVDANTVTGAGAQTQIAQNGIQLSNGATGTIQNNTVSGNLCDHASCGSNWYTQTQSAGIMLVSASGPVMISGNQVSTSDMGIYDQHTTDIATIQNNTLSNNRYFGILLADGDVSISGGSIAGSDIGVFNPSDRTESASTPRVSGVQITGDTVGLQNDAAYGVNATNNWWGSANPDFGSIISGDVSHDPWFINSERTILSDAVSGGDTITGTDSDVSLGSGGDADLPPGITNLVLSDNSDLDLLGGLVGGAVTLNSGVPGDPISLTNSNLANASASIPDGTEIQGPAGWDGKITPPISGTPPGGNSPAGFSVGGTVISIGSSAGRLDFDKPVTILLAGVTGSVGYRPAGTDTWVKINATCGGTYDNPDNPVLAGGECIISNNTDTKIVTYHFTSFGSLVAATESSGGGSSNTYSAGSVSTPTPVAPTVATSTVPTGQVLGATTFNFTSDLRNGMSGDAVTELQKRLTNEGVYSGPITGYFGPLTSAGVKAYQQKYGISQTGTVGPLTRAKLNVGQVAGVSTANTEVIRAQIASLQAQVVVLLQQLLQMLQGQAQ